MKALGIVLLSALLLSASPALAKDLRSIDASADESGGGGGGGGGSGGGGGHGCYKPPEGAKEGSVYAYDADGNPLPECAPDEAVNDSEIDQKTSPRLILRTF